jgi:hypothetical protein
VDYGQFGELPHEILQHVLRKPDARRARFHDFARGAIGAQSPRLLEALERERGLNLTLYGRPVARAPSAARRAARLVLSRLLMLLF